MGTGGGEWVHAALLSLVVGARLRGGREQGGGTDRGGAGTGKAGRAEPGADRVSQEDEGQPAGSGGTGVRGRRDGMLSGLGRLRVRQRRSAGAAGKMRSSTGKERQRAAADMVAAAAGAGVHHGSGSGGRRSGGRLRVRPGDRAAYGDAVRGTARALWPTDAGAQSGRTGGDVQPGAGGWNETTMDTGCWRIWRRGRSTRGFMC